MMVEAIEQKREAMITAGLTYGLTHPTTVRLSQELDELLNQEWRVKR